MHCTLNSDFGRSVSIIEEAWSLATTKRPPSCALLLLSEKSVLFVAEILASLKNIARNAYSSATFEHNLRPRKEKRHGLSHHKWAGPSDCATPLLSKKSVSFVPGSVVLLHLVHLFKLRMGRISLLKQTEAREGRVCGLYWVAIRGDHRIFEHSSLTGNIHAVKRCKFRDEFSSYGYNSSR